LKSGESCSGITGSEVQKAVREAILRRRSGSQLKEYGCAARDHPFLDEFIVNLQQTGWQNGPAMPLILNRLLPARW